APTPLKEMAFATAWAALQSRLRPGMTIQNWTAHKGPTGEPFEIVAVEADVVVVRPEQAQGNQRVKRSDFNVVYDHWDGYLGGEVQRQALIPLTRNSKYVISIWRWLQEHSGGTLP